KRENRRGPLSLFHAGREPRVTLMLDEAPEDEVYAGEKASTLSRVWRDIDAAERMVPTDLIAKMVLKVPFVLVYPPSVKASLEGYVRRQCDLPVNSLCRVMLERPKAMSDFVCSIQYESDSGLTEAIYLSADGSTT